MQDWISIGSTPVDEECSQIGSPDYYNWIKIEGNTYIQQLKRMFPAIEKTFSFFIRLKGFPHDFGTYHEVCLSYEDSDEEPTPSMELAFYIEANLPFHWDQEALNYLQSKKYPYANYGKISA